MDRRLAVLVVDDHFLLRKGVMQIISDSFKDVEFGEAENGQQAIEAVWTKTWDVVLLDITMPGRGGLDALKEIKKTRPNLPVIIVSMHPEDQFAIRVLKLGASAYIRKDCAGTELVKAVESAINGTPYITPGLAQMMAKHIHGNQNDAPESLLSDREYQVMRLIATGETVKEIASDLNLSVKTISTYRTRILEKMGLKNNSQIMRYALSRRIVAADES